MQSEKGEKMKIIIMIMIPAAIFANDCKWVCTERGPELQKNGKPIQTEKSRDSGSLTDILSQITDQCPIDLPLPKCEKTEKRNRTKRIRRLEGVDRLKADIRAMPSPMGRYRREPQLADAR